MRVVIALRGKPNSGKTTTIRRWVYDKLRTPENEIRPNKLKKEDFGILEIDGVKVGFCSVGDESSRLTGYLEWLVKAECLVIVCACRSIQNKKRLSSTAKVVDGMSRREPPYSIVWREKEQGLTDKEGGNRDMSDGIIADIGCAVTIAKRHAA